MPCRRTAAADRVGDPRGPRGCRSQLDVVVDVAAARRLGAGEELGRVRELDVVHEVRAAAARVT